MKKLFTKVGLGGTFDTIHTGHIRLITEALRRGRTIVIAITSDDFARKIKPYPVRSYTERLLNMKILVQKLRVCEDVQFEKLNDRYGSAAHDPEIEAITVSIETLSPAFEINDVRMLRGLQPLHIIVIPMIRDGLGVKYSSRWVREAISKAHNEQHPVDIEAVHKSRQD